MSTHNTNGDNVKLYNVADEDNVLSNLPNKLKNFLLYDCPFNQCAEQVMSCLKLGYSEDAILSELRKGIRRETREIYGQTHPQANGYYQTVECRRLDERYSRSDERFNIANV